MIKAYRPFLTSKNESRHRVKPERKTSLPIDEEINEVAEANLFIRTEILEEKNKSFFDRRSVKAFHIFTSTLHENRQSKLRPEFYS